MTADEGAPARAAWGVVAAATAGGAALRFYALARHSLWLDEVSTARDSATFATALAQDFHPPLHYLVTALFQALFGDGALALRAPAALAGTAAIPLAALAAHRLLGRREVAACAAVLVAVLPVFVFFSREARMYPLWLAATLVAVAGLATLVREPSSKRALALYWGGAFAAQLTHHYAAFYALGLFAAAWVLTGDHPLRKTRAELLRLAFWHAPFALAAGVGVVVLAAHHGGGLLHEVSEGLSVDREDPLAYALAQLLFFESWVYRPRAGAALWAKGLLLLALVFAVVAALARDERTGPRRALALALLLFLPLGLIAGLPIRGYARLLLPTAGLFTFVLAYAIAWPALRFGRRYLLSSGALLVGLLALVSPHLQHVYTREVEPWNDVCARLTARARAGEIVYVVPEYMDRPLLRCFARDDVKVQRVPDEKLGVRPHNAAGLARGAPGAWVVYTRQGKRDPEGALARDLARLFPAHERWAPHPQAVVLHFTSR